MAEVSAIIVNYNAGDFLMQSVASALENVDEVVLVDNHSTDHSLESCLQRFSGDGRLQVVRNNSNLGFAAACNAGAKMASGRYLFFLNPDCVTGVNAVTDLVHALESDSEVGMVGGLLLNPDGTEQGGGRRAVPTPWRSFVRAFGLSKFYERWPKLFFDFHLHNQPLPDHPIEVEAISGACMLLSRNVFEKIGPWDEAYFLHCEDLDICMRLRRLGMKILFVPAARFLHHQGACSKTRPIFVEWHKHKGMVRFYRKFFRHQYPGLLMWLVTVGVWLRFGLIVAVRLARMLVEKFKGVANG